MKDDPTPKGSADMEHNCIICISDDGYQIVGPFASDEALLSYGRRWQAENGDDPRWQSVYLADPAAPPKHVTPITERSADMGRWIDRHRVLVIAGSACFWGLMLGLLIADLFRH